MDSYYSKYQRKMRGTFQNVPLKIKLSVISNRNVIERLNSRFAFGIQIPAFVEHQGFHLTDIQNGIKHCGFDEVNHVFLIFKATSGGNADMLAAVLHTEAADKVNGALVARSRAKRKKEYILTETEKPDKEEFEFNNI